jgi:hypothetical protein
MALYAFDGTWNEAKQGDDPSYRHTNVVRFYDAYRARSGTNDFYRPGVGTRFDVVGKALGGVFGLGELPRIEEAYAHLCRQWATDPVIDVVGFSRGAATTLDFCHYVLEKGIRHPATGAVIEPNPTIRFLGVWDIVAAFGLANLGNTALNIGHHLSLPRANTRYCFHAMALDERRPSFLPTRLPGAYEVWFRGAHSDVGGGNGNRGLNDIALKWMFSKAMAAGLPIADADIAPLHPDPATRPKPSSRLPLDVRLIAAVDRRHYTVAPMPACTMPPDTCRVETAADERQAPELGAGGIEVLPEADRAKIAVLWEAAEQVARANGFTLEQSGDALLTLLQGRISLVATDAQLQLARHAVARLVATAAKGAQDRGFHVLQEYFLTEALFGLPHLYPLTD